MEIYESYSEEPKDIYLPLPEDIYCDLYELEMAHFSDDFSFYADSFAPASTILELGCGSGRVSNYLSSLGHNVTGADLSFPMLRKAQTKPGPVRYICMDIREIALHSRFDAIIIPYNTLNLLTASDDIQNLFMACHRLLNNSGILLFQVQQVTPAILELTGNTTAFTFSLFDLPGGGKVVKEIIRSFEPATKQLHMTERYKLRPTGPGRVHRNYIHTLELILHSKDFWVQSLRGCGFSNLRFATSFPGDTSSPDGLLLLHAKI